MNIVDPILFQSRYHPPDAAICAPGTDFNVVSYSRLEQFIHNVSRRAVSIGLSRGNTVAIFVQDHILHAAIFLGLARLGVITLASRGMDLPKELPIDAVMTDRKNPIPLNISKVIPVDASWTTGPGTPLSDARLYHVDSDDICRIVLTSGTTGVSKAVALSHGMIAARVMRHAYAWGNTLSECSRLFCDLGYTTGFGICFLIDALSKGGTIFFAGHNFESTVQAFDLYKVQAMLTSPQGLAAYTKFYEAAGSFRPSFDLVIAGGSVMPKALSEHARARLCSNLICSYGATETSMVATVPAHLISEIPGAVGRVIPDISVEIIDRSGTVLPPGREGVVRIRSDYNVPGYFHTPDSARSFRDGWFYPGDLGYLTADRLLVISGREEAILNIGGDKVNPETIENAVGSFNGVDEVAAFCVPNEFGVDRLWVAVVMRSPFNEQALRDHCGRVLPRSLMPARIIAVDKLPKNDWGKLERTQLRDLATNVESTSK